MFNLLYKEFRLAAHPTLFIFMLLGALVIIPSYPYSVVFFFGCLAPFITMMYGRENHDIFYTVLLPVQKKDIVKAKCALFTIIQIGQLLVSIPFAVMHVLLFPQGNVVGIEPNMAYYGFGFMVYGIFNLIFFTDFYKTAYKSGKAFILGLIPTVLFIIIIETLPHLPGMSWIESTSSNTLLWQLPILFGGIIVYIICMIAAFKIAAKRFKHVDL